MALRPFHHAIPAFLAAAIALPVTLWQSPRTNVKVHDFQRLQWLEGDWVGSGGSYDAFYERYTFVNDSTIEQQSFTDGTMKTVSEHSTIALRNGRIVNTSGTSRYEAVALDANGIAFASTRPNGNSFVFKRASKGKWLATIRSQAGKRTVYEMRPKR